MIFIIYYISDFQLISRFDKKRISGSARDWTYTLLVWLVAIFITFQPIVLPGFELAINNFLLFSGIVISILGFLLNRWARLHLGHLFFEGEEFQSSHYLVNTGPYRFVRHPIYVSIMLISLGILVINSSIFMLFLFAYSIFDFTRAARRDEKILLSNLPEYKNYMERTPRFFPKIFH